MRHRSPYNRRYRLVVGFARAVRVPLRFVTYGDEHHPGRLKINGREYARRQRARRR